MRSYAKWVLAGVLVFSAVGCREKGGTNPADGGVDAGGSGGWTLAEACTEGWRLFCEKQEACGIVPDAVECARVGSQTCEGEDSPLAQAIQAGRVDFDGAAAKACFEALASAPCLPPWDQVLGIPDCRGYLGGKVPDGEACYASGVNECTQGVCLREGGVCPGVCSAWIPAGGDCSGDKGLGCVEGTYCDGSVCVVRAGADASCNPAYIWSCASGFNCVPDGSGGGRCKPIVAEGGSCTKDEECLVFSACAGGTCKKRVESGEHCVVPWNCPAGEYCYDHDDDPSTPDACAAPIAEGDPCTPDQVCADGLLCSLDTFSGTWTCEVDTVGQACAACAADQWCDTTYNPPECKPRGGDGAPCDYFTGEGCLDGFYCDTTAENCVAKGDAGAGCSSSDECASGLCASNGTCAAVCTAP